MTWKAKEWNNPRWQVSSKSLNELIVKNIHYTCTYVGIFWTQTWSIFAFLVHSSPDYYSLTINYSADNLIELRFWAWLFKGVSSNPCDFKSERLQSKFLKGVDLCLLIYATTRITYILLRKSTWKFLQTEWHGMILKLVILNSWFKLVSYPDTPIACFYDSNNNYLCRYSYKC